MCIAEARRRSKIQPGAKVIRPQATPAIEPIFFNPETHNSLSAEDQEASKAATEPYRRNWKRSILEGVACSVKGWKDMSLLEQDLQIERFEKGCTHLERKLAEAGHENKFGTANLTPELVKDIPATIAGHCSPAWEGPDGKLSLDVAIAACKEPWKGTRKPGDKMTTEESVRNEFVGAANNDGRALGEDSVTSALHEDERSETTRFKQLHTTLDAIGGVRPSYEFARSLLRANDKLAPPEGDEMTSPGQVYWSGLWLFPWQVVGIGFKQMPILTLKTASLADH